MSPVQFFSLPLKFQVYSTPVVYSTPSYTKPATSTPVSVPNPGRPILPILTVVVLLFLLLQVYSTPSYKPPTVYSTPTYKPPTYSSPVITYKPPKTTYGYGHVSLSPHRIPSASDVDPQGYARRRLDN